MILRLRRSYHPTIHDGGTTTTTNHPIRNDDDDDDSNHRMERHTGCSHDCRCSHELYRRVVTATASAPPQSQRRQTPTPLASQLMVVGRIAPIELMIGILLLLMLIVCDRSLVQSVRGQTPPFPKLPLRIDCGGIPNARWRGGSSFILDLASSRNYNISDQVKVIVPLSLRRPDDLTISSNSNSNSSSITNNNSSQMGPWIAAPETVYRTHKFFRSTNRSALFQYHIPVESSYKGSKIVRVYTVRLHFAETYFSEINKRIMDIKVQDDIAVRRLDVVAAAGGPNIAHVIDIRNVTVLDDIIAITFLPIKQNPMISGIEIFQSVRLASDTDTTTTPTTTPTTNIETSAPIVTVAPVTHFPTASPLTLPPDSPPTRPTSFRDIFINCGGSVYLEKGRRHYWGADNFFTGGSTYSITSIPVSNTVDDYVYQTERLGLFSYEVPVPVGVYEISIHLAELVFTTQEQRIFNLTVESMEFSNVDIVAIAGSGQRAISLSSTLTVDDGAVSISVARIVNEPKISGIEIRRSIPHLAHAVSNGPYFGVDSDDDGFAIVALDGSESHTHALDAHLVEWIWREGSTVIARGKRPKVTFSVGEHNIDLTILDDRDNESTEATTVQIHPLGFPSISSISPTFGMLQGGENVTITGTGFKYNSNRIVVRFGAEQFTGKSIRVVNATTIIVTAPKVPFVAPVKLSVETPLGRSMDTVVFTYLSSIPINFSTKSLMDFSQPTSAAFGPDGKLYIGSIKGTLAKVKMDADYTYVISVVTAVVQPDRAILGIAFDPMDAGNPIPPVYISSSQLYHGESKSSSGTAINGKVSRVIGANLDVVEDIVTGLPVCDSDHAVNQIEFGNKGELYINVGSNTNGGLPGKLSGSGRMIENYFSAATLVADLSNPTFDGHIEYDALDDGSPTNYSGVFVFASGLRNPFGLTMHSNGNLYGTDNGPNLGYGRMKMGCAESDILFDQQREDKLVLIKQNRYYGHPNPKRASHDNDPRQCVWHNPTESSSSEYQAPIGVLLSSATGMIEYKSDHFDKQLRNNLIHAKFKSRLYRSVIMSDGDVHPLSLPGIPLLGGAGLDVTQAPNGNLIEVRYVANKIFVSRAVEPEGVALKVYSVFPTRGSVLGGTKLSIYGVNFGEHGGASVTVGNKDCPITRADASYIECVLPGGRSDTLVDIVVSSNKSSPSKSYTFAEGYRYVDGKGFRWNKNQAKL